MNKRVKVPKGLTYRDIGIRDIGVLKVEKVGHFKSRNSESESEPSVCGDMWWRSRLSEKVLIEKSTRRIGVRRFTDPEDKTSGASKVLKSRDWIRAVHLEGMRGEDLRSRKKSRKGRLHLSFRTRQIGSSVGKRLGKSMLETL
jgi:hypothetical protein